MADAQRTRSLDGRAVLPDDAGWDVARSVWNGMIDRQPLGVIQAASPEDVVAGIGSRRDLGLPLAVRGGGHNVAGNGTVEGGLVIDLRPMHDVSVDPGTRVVRSGAARRSANWTAGRSAMDVVVPAGVVSGTGVGGLTLGGGMGWLTRAYGLTIDRLLSVDLVTADGRQVTRAPTRTGPVLGRPGRRRQLRRRDALPVRGRRARAGRPRRVRRSIDASAGPRPCASTPVGADDPGRADDDRRRS